MGETHVNEQKSLTELMGEEKPQPQEEKKAEHNSANRVEGMRKRTDLSDIILEKENSTAGRNKKIILGAASLVLLFLVFLIISKIINSNMLSVQEQVADKEEVKQEKIKIEETNKEPIKIVETKTKKEEKTPDIKDTDLKFEEMVKKLREEEAKENSEEVVKVVTPPNSKVKKSVKPENSKNVIKNIEITEPKKEQKIIITEAKKTIPKKITKPKIQRPKRNIIFGQNSGYFVQVGATTSPNPNRFLVAKIKQNGYSYITHPVVVKGKRFYKVLIGPYGSKTEALNKLPRIRATINPQAFLYRLR